MVTPELRRQLVEDTVAFASAYLRWVGARGSDGIPYPRLRLLETLACKGADTMGAVGDHLGLSPRQMTALVDALEQDGLVIRRTHPSDRRAFLLQLTDKGLEEASACYEDRIGVIGALFDDLSVAEQKTFLELVDSLRDGLRRRRFRV